LLGKVRGRLKDALGKVPRTPATLGSTLAKPSSPATNAFESKRFVDRRFQEQPGRVIATEAPSA